MKRFLSIIAAILISHIVSGQMPLLPTTSDVTAWWPFCADYVDHVNGFNLTNGTTGFPAATLTTDRFGNTDAAFAFSGTGNIIQYPTTFPANGNFSYSVWFNPSVAQRSIILYNGNITTNGFGFVMLDSTSATATGSDVAVWFAGQPRILPQRVALNQWHHAVLTKSGTFFQFYLDTTYIGGFNGSFPPPGGQFTLGLDYFTGNMSFDGSIDDVAIYGKALSFAEIKNLAKFNPGVTTIDLGNDTSICTNALTIGPLTPLTGLYDKIWNTGDTAANITVGPAYYPGTGYRLTVSRPSGCTATDSIHLIHSRISIDLGHDTTICGNNTVTLSGTVTGAAYTWNTGATTSSIFATTSGIYSVLVDSNGCQARDTIVVNVKPAPHFDLGPDRTTCDGTAVLLADTTSTYVSPVFSWGGNPVPPSSLNTYSTTATVIGQYWLEVTDTNGCPGFDTVNATIIFDTFTLRNTDTVVCKHTALTAKVTGIQTPPIPNYQWTPSTGMAISNDSVSLIIADTTTLYTITVTLGPCIVKDSFKVTVQPDTINVYLGGNRHKCSGDTVQIRPLVTPAWFTGYIYTWTPSLYISDPTVKDVIFTNPTSSFPPDDDSVKVKLVVTTSAGCVGADSILVFRHFDSVKTVTRLTPACPRVDQQIFITMEDPTTTKIVWRPSAGINDSTSFSPIFSPVTSTNYIGYTKSPWGCIDTVHMDATVWPAAVVNMPDSVGLYDGESFQISPQTNCTKFSWFPPEGLNDTTFSDPLASPSSNTTYYLWARTEHSCEVRDSIKIRVDETTLLAVPNAFAPGGSNNKLFVFKRGVARLTYFNIYDRWGNQVFSTTNINDGWDGTFNGKLMPMGVYVYDAEAVTNLGKIFHKQGNVTLLR